MTRHEGTHSHFLVREARPPPQSSSPGLACQELLPSAAQPGVAPRSYFRRRRGRSRPCELFMENGFPFLAAGQGRRTCAGREESCSAEKLVDRHTLIFWRLTKQARWMPKFNKITHYCLIGAVLRARRSSEELPTGSLPPFLKSIVSLGSFLWEKRGKGKMQPRE